MIEKDVVVSTSYLKAKIMALNQTLQASKAYQSGLKAFDEKLSEASLEIQKAKEDQKAAWHMVRRGEIAQESFYKYDINTGQPARGLETMKLLHRHDKVKKMNRVVNDGIITNISSSSSSEDESSDGGMNKDWKWQLDDESDDFE